MRIVGYACRHSEPPLREAYLPLDGLTVLLGPNDSGKSSLLRAVERDLSGGHYHEVAEETAKEIGGVFYVEVSDRELAALIKRAQTAVRRVRESSDRGYLGRRPPWGLRGWTFEHLPAAERDALDEDPIAAWLAVLREHAPDTQNFSAVLDALANSRLLGLEPAGFENDDPVWNVFWCLEPRDKLEAEVSDALRASPLRPFDDARERERRSGIAFIRGFYEPFHGRPRHLWVAGAPVAGAPIGQVTEQVLPRGLAVPEEADKIRDAVADAVDHLTTAARHGLEDAQREEPLTAAESEARAIPRNWLESAGSETYRIHLDTRGASALVGAAANRLLPTFIAEAYRIEVVLRELTSWFGDRPVDLRLTALRDDRIVEDFPIEEVADGYRLWVQLAVLEACEEASRAAAVLREYAASAWSAEESVRHAHTEQDPDADDLQAQADAQVELFESVRSELRTVGAGERPWVEGPLRERLEAAPTTEWSRNSARHRRFFVVDEPERHLHPRRQREAASWLATTTSARQTPCLVATHSTAFLSLPASEGLSYVFVNRAGDRITLEPFAAGDLEVLDQAVETLGFDRGELLTTVALFLVVEGRHDQEVLERIFGRDLRAAHVAVVPMEGVGAWRAILDSHALWRYSTAAVALATDKFEPDTLRELLDDPEKLRALRRSDAPEETKVLAKLLGTAQQQGKTIHLLGHPGADLIDVLDEGVVQSLYPRYPGHAEAQRLWQHEVAAGAAARQRKVFYEREFGVPNDVVAYAKLGDAHAEANVRPPQLARLIDETVKLAGEARP